MWNLDYVVRDIKDLYDYAHANNLTLLPTINYDFWEEVNDNTLIYDKSFKRMYSSYVYFDQDITGDNPVSVVYNDFYNSVCEFLILNEKRFSELYKIESVESTISPFYNQYIQQTRTGTRNASASNVLGIRTDRTVQDGMAFNSADFVDKEGVSFTKGSETDTNTLNETIGNTLITQGSNSNPIDNVEKYKDFWSHYDFYNYIFKEISKELLLIK